MPSISRESVRAWCVRGRLPAIEASSQEYLPEPMSSALSKPSVSVSIGQRFVLIRWPLTEHELRRERRDRSVHVAHAGVVDAALAITHSQIAWQLFRLAASAAALRAVAEQHEHVAPALQPLP